MSSVVERDITHIRSLHNANLGSQHRVNNKYAEYLIDKLTPQSKDRFSAVNCTTSMAKDKRMEHEGKDIALDPGTSMMLQNVSIQQLSYG